MKEAVGCVAGGDSAQTVIAEAADRGERKSLDPLPSRVRTQRCGVSSAGASREPVRTRAGWMRVGFGFGIGKNLAAESNPLQPALGHFRRSLYHPVCRAQRARAAVVQVFKLHQPRLPIHTPTRQHLFTARRIAATIAAIRFTSSLNDMAATYHVFDYLEQSPPPAHVQVIFGDEPFLKRLAIQHLRAIASPDEDLPIATFDGTSVAWRDVRDELYTVSLFNPSGLRVALVEDADTFVTDNRAVGRICRATAAAWWADPGSQQMGRQRQTV